MGGKAEWLAAFSEKLLASMCPIARPLLSAPHQRVLGNSDSGLHPAASEDIQISPVIGAQTVDTKPTVSTVLEVIGWNAGLGFGSQCQWDRKCPGGRCLG